MAKNTKQRILDEALVMFSERGYEGTNLRELAQTMGLAKSALYRHFPCKEDIWNSLFDQIEEHYSQSFSFEGDAAFAPTTCEEFLETVQNMVDFTLSDQKVRLARRLLLTEQFRNARARDLANEHFVDRFDRVFPRVFASMIDAGVLRLDDPTMLALEFSAPVSALVIQCDRTPELEGEIKQRIRAYMERFLDEHRAGKA